MVWISFIWSVPLTHLVIKGNNDYARYKRTGKHMAKIAFIGIGVMGGPIAGHLAKAGHDLTVYNRTRAKAEAWVAKYGGSIADNPGATKRS